MIGPSMTPISSTSENCRQCGASLPARRRLKAFCNYACRGQHKALEAISGPSGLVGSKNVKQNRALRSLKRQSIGQFTFARLNSCTVRIDAANKRGVGWLIDVASSRWVARVGNRASKPLTLEAAKNAAAALLRERENAKPRDWIAELSQLAANEVDRVALEAERKRWPLDILGGHRRGKIDLELRNAILSAELEGQPSGASLSGDDRPLTYDADGNVELPARLDRRKPKIVEEAA